jgi:hypothetical protein
MAPDWSGLKLDITDPLQIADAASKAKVSLLINNAGARQADQKAVEEKFAEIR